jgi:hypothetical protein
MGLTPPNHQENATLDGAMADIELMIHEVKEFLARLDQLENRVTRGKGITTTL